MKRAPTHSDISISQMPGRPMPGTCRRWPVRGHDTIRVCSTGGSTPGGGCHLEGRNPAKVSGARQGCWTREVGRSRVRKGRHQASVGAYSIENEAALTMATDSMHIRCSSTRTRFVGYVSHSRYGACPRLSVKGRE
jgi:hypothetical protein